MEYHLPIPHLPQPGLNHVPRSQTSPIPKRQTRHTTLHLKLRVRAELERKAKEEELSVSATGAAILEWFFEQSISMQHAATLETVIEKSIGKHMRSYSNRLAVLLVRSLVTTDVVLSIVTNILGRHPGMTQKDLAKILTASDNKARANITRITPQLKTFIEAVQREFMEEVRQND